MKKIGIDARLIGKTGVGVYIRNLLHYISKLASSEFIFYIYLLENDFEKYNFDSNLFVKKQTLARWHSFQEQIIYAQQLFQDNLDLVHFTYFSYPLLYRKKFIATVHDLTPLYFKTGKASTQNPILYEVKHFFFKKVISAQIKNSQKIITPCKTVKKQIVDFFGEVYEKKIEAIYEGISYELQNVSEEKNLFKQFTKPFFIYVGNFYPHKNVEKLITAFAQIKSEVPLILVGPEDYFTARLKQQVSRYRLSHKIIFYHNSNPSRLAFFYKHALALIHPSLSEGFGLPIIEAAYYNLPIIASDIAVFKELLGNNYLSFNPYDQDDITSKIKMFLTNGLKFDYKDILKKYSFEKMTHDTLALYSKTFSNIFAYKK